MTDAREQLIEYISAEAVFHGDFTLTSGKKATYYVDLRKVSLDHRVAPLIGQVMLDLIADVPDVGAVGGMTMGADPIAAAVLHQGAARGLAYDAFVVRKEPKDHGRGKQVEGPDLAGKRVIVLEDTSTTGGSPLKAIEALREGRRRDRRRRRRRRPRHRRPRGDRGRGVPPGRDRTAGPGARMTERDGRRKPDRWRRRRTEDAALDDGGQGGPVEGDTERQRLACRTVSGAGRRGCGRRRAAGRCTRIRATPAAVTREPALGREAERSPVPDAPELCVSDSADSCWG